MEFISGKFQIRYENISQSWQRNEQFSNLAMHRYHWGVASFVDAPGVLICSYGVGEYLLTFLILLDFGFGD